MAKNVEFDQYILSDTGENKYIKINNLFDNLLSDVIEVCPSSRELSLVKTKLEEACYFAKRAMVLDPKNCR